MQSESGVRLDCGPKSARSRLGGGFRAVQRMLAEAQEVGDRPFRGCGSPMKLGERTVTWKSIMATGNLGEYKTGIPRRFGDVSLVAANLRLEGGAIFFFSTSACALNEISNQSEQTCRLLLVWRLVSPFSLPVSTSDCCKCAALVGAGRRFLCGCGAG